MHVTIRYFAAARAAAGVESAVLDVDDEATLGDLEAVLGKDNPDLGRVLERCSYLRDSVALCDRGARLGRCDTLDVLPPFAGG
ncbi:MoaD/ThiS family protein [Gordonia sp. Z-3]|uniref:MoaD/ThiS family protein n=2 Tax=Gordonia TaxID=2053 RepID=A0A9X3D8F0_9ACTN|nr:MULTISPECIES: MoaD/ThiS family protein [Gordonia]MAU84844.1 molybdopterin synthase sulfur carrier subunit [Gordonia sp. (in: high G+C Gram-positive bacteria)]MCF3941001.1 MoaD/ThiS family protein [Gordonia tangerina]MCX2965557.1 MoaD/ThiS family protein [Gordonia aquimaris]MED5800058.1 MoaD/ThiS family protein [Gordonia sp. Z-3]